MTSLLITGARGQLGRELMALAAARGLTAVGFGSAELDITDSAAVHRAVADMTSNAAGPVVVINTAAYTAVDAAETDRDRAFAVNEAGPRQLALAAADHGAGLIHVSTDYVFPGDGARPYEPTDPTGPASVYGASKLAGERAVQQAHSAAHVVRTSWLYGAGGPNFVKTMVALESSRDTISVVDDQHGSPTWSYDLASGLIELARAGTPGGVLHATGSGETTWCGLAKAVFEELGADPARVLPIPTAEFPRPAPRPSYSVLSDAAWRAAGLTPLPNWRDSLHRAFEHQADAFQRSA